MFVTLNQLYVFIACVSFGGVVGVLYSPILLLKEKFKKNIFVFILEIFYYLLTTLMFIWYSYLLKFPNLRGYMIAGVLIGILLYVKSFHYMLAKLIKRYYNILRKYFLRKKSNDRRKNKKINNSVNGGGSIATLRSPFGHGIRARGYKAGKQGKDRVGK